MCSVSSCNQKARRLSCCNWQPGVHAILFERHSTGLTARSARPTLNTWVSFTCSVAQMCCHKVPRRMMRWAHLKWSLQRSLTPGCSEMWPLHSHNLLARGYFRATHLLCEVQWTADMPQSMPVHHAEVLEQAQCSGPRHDGLASFSLPAGNHRSGPYAGADEDFSRTAVCLCWLLLANDCLLLGMSAKSPAEHHWLPLLVKLIRSLLLYPAHGQPQLEKLVMVD